MKASNAQVMTKVFEHAKAVDEMCEKNGGKRILTVLFGSQNYDLDTDQSDVDTKSIVAPDVENWLWNEVHYDNINMSDGSHAEIKNVTAMFKQFIKGNINFLELLYSPYVDIAPGWEWFYEELIAQRDNISRHNMYKQGHTWISYCQQMRERTTHCSQFAELKDGEHVDSMGYDYNLHYNPKALMNALRLKESCIRFFEFQQPFDEAIDMGDMRETLLKVKMGNLDRETVNNICNDLDVWIVRFDSYITNHYTDHEVFDAIGYLKKLAVKTFSAMLVSGKE